jgi:pyridinium-3,5-biscarboxylic acid mononucleotide sulfurtransferase
MKESFGTAMNTTITKLDDKLAQMQSILRELRSVAVAFSAGVDSTLVLKVAIDTLGPDNVVAVTGRSDSLAAAEFEQACQLADSLGAEHVVIDTDEFENPNYLANPTNRCYFCKTTLYEHLGRFIAARGLHAIVNGINADDYGDFRPGIQAAGEHSVRCPAAEAGLTKSDVRELSHRFGLPTFDKPASPCLSSRVPYGESITPEKLRMIERGEAFLHALGIRECRVRHHDKLARIEVPPEQIDRLANGEMRERLDRFFRELGYQYVTIDLRGFRSGSMNEVIAFGQVQPNTL